VACTFWTRNSGLPLLVGVPLLRPSGNCRRVRRPYSHEAPARTCRLTEGPFPYNAVVADVDLGPGLKRSGPAHRKCFSKLVLLPTSPHPCRRRRSRTGIRSCHYPQAVDLAGFDGIEAARRIRTFSDAYLIMITKLTAEEDELMGLAAGADNYLGKAFRQHELRARSGAMLRSPEYGFQGCPF
jgi:CheY-like chemotaxis protein